MRVYAFAQAGYEGRLVSVEVDIRRSIPGVDVIGLPDSAVKESRERVRAAIKNSGLEFPQDRILVNLSPAGIRKEGSGFDLAIAIAILASSGGLEGAEPGLAVLVMGELMLSGDVLPVRGALNAAALAQEAGIPLLVVPPPNGHEARAYGGPRVLTAPSLVAAAESLRRTGDGSISDACLEPYGPVAPEPRSYGDFKELVGRPELVRAMELAAAGGHHALILGPPGVGKTMAARRLPGILPPLCREDALAATRIHSLAGCLDPEAGLLRIPPFRAPHHSATRAGILGGGPGLRPGEASLAHAGVLFLDEAPEFQKGILDDLREPLETGRIELSRAHGPAWFPARFQLVMAANPCPCGKLGTGACLCSLEEAQRYRRRIMGPLLDRIDIRLVVGSQGASAEKALMPGGSSEMIAGRVAEARARQAARAGNQGELCGGASLNARMGPAEIEARCALSPSSRALLIETARRFGISSRGVHGALRLARTVADLAGEEEIKEEFLIEALGHRGCLEAEID
jgi:magnesium chelatase family protein